MSYSKRLLLTFFVAFIAACGTKVPITEQAPVVESPPLPVVVPPPPPPAPPTVVPRNVEPVQAPAPAAIQPGIVYFDFDSFVIKPEYQGVLESQAKFLNSNKNAKISLGGHTDDQGGREYNLSLGQKRADAVKRALSILGVAEMQMEAVSFGKEKPAVATADDAARAKNRRVELAAP